MAQKPKTLSQPKKTPKSLKDYVTPLSVAGVLGVLATAGYFLFKK